MVFDGGQADGVCRPDAVTSIQEQTLTFVPKIIAVFVGIMIFGSWILTNLTEFVTTLWSNFSIYLG